MRSITKIEEIKQIVTGFHTLEHVKDNIFEVELEVISNTNGYVGNNEKPIVINRKFILKVNKNEKL